MPKIIDDIPMEQLISRQFRLWERTYDKGMAESETQIKPCVTISKELGSQGVELAQGLSKKLHWRVFDKELVDFIAVNANVRKNMVESFDEKTQNEIHNWVLTLLSHHALGCDQYLKHLITVITAIGENGRAMILGRGGNFILPAQKTLRIKVVAPLDNRIKYVMNQKKVNKKQALEMISSSDKERIAFIQRFFRHDSEDLTSYDLVLNLGTVGLAVAEQIVLMALKLKFPAFEFSDSE